MDPKQNPDLEQLFNKLGNIHRSRTEFEFLPTAEMIVQSVLAKTRDDVLYENRVVTLNNRENLKKRWETKKPRWYHHVIELHCAEGVLRYCELLVDVNHELWVLSQNLNLKSKVIVDAVSSGVLQTPVTDNKINSIKADLSKRVDSLNNVLMDWLSLIVEQQQSIAEESETQSSFKPWIEPKTKTDDKTVSESKSESESSSWSWFGFPFPWRSSQETTKPETPKQKDTEPSVKPKAKPKEKPKTEKDMDELLAQQLSMDQSELPEIFQSHFFPPGFPTDKMKPQIGRPKPIRPKAPPPPIPKAPPPPIPKAPPPRRSKGPAPLPPNLGTVVSPSQPISESRITTDITHTEIENFMTNFPRRERSGFRFLPNRLDILESCCQLRYVSDKRILGQNDYWIWNDWKVTHPEWYKDLIKLNAVQGNSGPIDYCHQLIHLCKEIHTLINDLSSRGDAQSDISRLRNQGKVDRSLEVVLDMLKLDYEQIVLLSVVWVEKVSNTIV